jgi:hypothetical protein
MKPWLRKKCLKCFLRMMEGGREGERESERESKAGWCRPTRKFQDVPRSFL